MARSARRGAFDQIVDAVEVEFGLAFLDDGADPGGQDAAQTSTAAADASWPGCPGTSSTSISPAIICRPVSGLVPMCDTMALRTRRLAISRPIPKSRPCRCQ